MLRLVYLAVLVMAYSELYGEDDVISVELRSKSQYVLGEPVVLQIKATNNSGRHLKVGRPSDLEPDPDISIYLSTDNQKFERFLPGLADIISCGRNVPQDFPHGQSWEHRRWVLYTETIYEKESRLDRRYLPRRISPDTYTTWGRLAFDKPARYWIKVGYPVAVWEPLPKGRTYESNTIEISVKLPQGEDAKIWQKLNNPRYLFFLQAAQVPWIYEGDKRRTFPEVPTQLVELLTTMPKSCYHDDIKEALTRYYWHRRKAMRPDKAFADKELTLIRKATGIKDFVSTLFTNDRRLDAEITFDFPPMTTRLQAFDYFSDQTGVPLTMDPRLEKSIVTPRPKMSLRTFMDRGNGGITKWVKDGDGYKLIVDEDAIKRIMQK